MLELKQAVSFSHSLDAGRVRLPKFAIYGKQVTRDKCARFLWVNDPRVCAYTSFRVNAMDVETGEVYSFTVDAATSSIGRTFARYADSLPIDRIHAPVYRASNSDADTMGPHDRRPQTFDRRRSKPQRDTTMTDRSVVDGCVIGNRRYTQEGYYYTFLKI